MTRENIADLLRQAAVRLSKDYFGEVERERDSRWAGNVDEAAAFHNEAEETRTLAEECRKVAARLLDDDISLRIRVRRRNGPYKAEPAENTVIQVFR